MLYLKCRNVCVHVSGVQRVHIVGRIQHNTGRDYCGIKVRSVFPKWVVLSDQWGCDWKGRSA